MRDWLVIIGVLVVLVVLADGLRRIWLARRKENELSFGLEDIQGQADDFGSELPNGGARLKDGQTLSDLDDVKGTAPVREEPTLSPEPVQASPRVTPKAEHIANGVPVGSDEPAVTDVVSSARVVEKEKATATVEGSAEVLATEVQPEPIAESAIAPEATVDSQPDAPLQSQPDVRKDPSVLPGQQALALDEPVPVLMDMDLRAEPDRRRKPAEAKPSREPMSMPFSFDVEELEDKAKKLRDKIRPSSRKVKSSEPVEVVAEREIEGESAIEGVQPAPAPMEEILVINVKAPEGQPFTGDKLLEIFRDEGLRFGDMNIFHRHVREDGSGQILFSVANGVEPGTFDLKTMENSSIPALSFFMGLPGPEEPQQAFRILVEAVHHLSRDLGGILRDEQHSVLTGQTLEHYRQRISDFERRHLCQRKKSTARV
ncbi:cell division protein ZipA [Sansalvadorimonas verongulae]|uniref:cell division protein ZipA n=1 Tax=Sansalvadorimonas verongulae TaxID=2172824 RepID=UPI001E55F0DE|nr:cell division protein ZipA [Sansalvadorimonas verongulae]